jgi:hypothetical protein
MKKTLCAMLIAATLLVSFSILARGYGHSSSSYRSHSLGSTHYVRPYVKQNGTYVKGHLSGNPYSGVHCHDNVCN